MRQGGAAENGVVAGVPVVDVTGVTVASGIAGGLGGFEIVDHHLGEVFYFLRRVDDDVADLLAVARGGGVAGDVDEVEDFLLLDGLLIENPERSAGADDVERLLRGGDEVLINRPAFFRRDVVNGDGAVRADGDAVIAPDAIGLGGGVECGVIVGGHGDKAGTFTGAGSAAVTERGVEGEGAHGVGV